MRRKSFYLYSTPETVRVPTKPRAPEYQAVRVPSRPRTPEFQPVSLPRKPSAPEYQTIPGYSMIMDARLDIDDHSEPKISRYDGQTNEVSLASSLGTVKGPKYPHRPNLAPATLQPVVMGNQPPTKLYEYSDKNSIRKSYNSDRKTPVKNRRKTTQKPYFNTDQYDPFAFQSTARPKIKQHSVTENSIFSNRLDSRFSIQVNNFTAHMHS